MLTRHVQRASLILGAVVAALLFFLGGAALRLLMGPVSFGPFAGIIEDALNHSVSGVVIRFDQAVLEWSRAEGKVNLIVLGTKVFDSNGRIIAQAPKADLDFDAAALVAGHLNLKRFGLIGVQLAGRRSPEGAIRLGFGRDQEDANLLDTIRDILKNSADGGGSLETFSIRNARLAFQDEPTGLFIIAPDASFTLQNKGKTLDAGLESAVEISGVPARIVAHAVLRADGTPESGNVDIKGLSLPALVLSGASFAALKPYQMTGDIHASFSLDESGSLLGADFHTSGTGNIETSLLTSPLHVTRLIADGHFDAAKMRLTLAGVRFDTQQLSAQAKGDFTLGWIDGSLATLSGNLEARNVQLDVPVWFHQPVALERVSLQANYDRSAEKITWQRAIVKGGAFSADLSGTTRFGGAGAPAIAVTGSLDALAVADALKYWPADVADGARSWIEANIPEGRIGPVRIEADLPPGALDGPALPDTALTVTFPFEGLTARYIAGMTPLTGGHGEAKLTGDTFHVAVAAALVGPLALSDGDVTIPDLHTTGALSRIKAHAEGTMVQVLQLIDEEPLAYPKRFGVVPTTVAGRAAVDLDFQLPLLRDLMLDQVKIGVQAKATDLGLPIDNRKLEHGMVVFAIDSKSLTAEGTGNLQSVPVSFKWTEDFGGDGITTRIDLAGRLDETARANLGLSEPKWLTGTMPATLALTGRRFHFDEGTLKADLTNAAADIPVLNFSKRAGVRANASAALRFGSGGAITIRDLAVAGDGLSVRGGLSLDGAGKIVNVSLSNFRSGVNDFALNMEPIAGGGLNINIQGKTLDGSHFLGDKKKSANAPPEKDAELQDPFALNARVERLVFHDNVGFRDVALSLAFGANEKLNSFSLDAMGTGKGKVTGRMSVVKSVRNLSLDTDDAGAFIDTFLGFSSIKNGTLAARISFPGDAVAVGDQKLPPDYQGTITLSDVVVTDQPFIARLFSAGSLDGPLRLLQGDGIALGTVVVPFSARGQMITIREGRASGAAIGLTFEGTLDRKSERVDVAGSLVPVYAVNSFLGGVPVVGDILVSKKGEGIFGLTYAMKGNLNEPSLTVNPLSVLTPGIFRRIFEFATPKEAVPPQAAVSPPAGAPPAATQQ